MLKAFACLVGILIGVVPPLSAQPAKKPVAIKERPIGRAVRCVAFSPAGTLLAAALGEPEQCGRVILWDAAKREQLWSHWEDDGVPAVAFSPNGKTLAIGGYDNTAKLLDTATGRVLKVFEGHTNIVRAVAFSPDGKTLATGGWDKSVRLWDLASGTVLKTFDWPGERLFGLSFSPGGQWLLACEEYLRVWEVATGKEQRALGGERDYMEWAVFADDDWLLATGVPGTVRCLSVATGEKRALFHHLNASHRLAFSPQARRFAVGTHDIQLYDFTLQQPTAKEAQRMAALLLKFDDDDYAVREAAGKNIRALGYVTEPELRRLMKDSPSAEVRIRCRRLRQALLTESLASLSGHTGPVESLAFSPDGRVLANGSMDGSIRLWDVAKAKETARMIPSGQ